MKLLICIDGDNVDESYTSAICNEAKRFAESNEPIEIHCFCDFLKRKQAWKTAYYEYGVQLHYIPGMEKHKKNAPDPNTSDIALTAFAVKKLYENPELQTCIIVSNDKDYAPLAKMIMGEFHKKAVLFYSQTNDKATAFYSEAILLKEVLPDNETADKKDVAVPVSDALSAATASKEANKIPFIDFLTISACIEEQLQTTSTILLAELGPLLKSEGISYGKSLGKFLETVFNSYPVLKQQYKLKLGNKADSIERIA